MTYTNFILLLGLGLLFLNGSVAANDASERKKLISKIESEFDSISRNFGALDRSDNARDVQKIISDAKSINGYVKQLDRVKGSDKTAIEITKDYPREIPKFLTALKYLAAAKENQYKLDPIVDVCSEEGEELRDAVAELVEEGDPEGADDVEDLAEDVEDKISSVMKDAASLLKKVDSIARKAKQFSYRKGLWNPIDRSLDASADTIVRTLKSSLKEAEEACEDLLLGDAQDFVEDAMQALEDMDQAAEEFVKDGEAWFAKSRSVFALSCSAMEEVRKAYCGEDFEPGETSDAKLDSIANNNARAVVNKLKPILKEYESLKKRGEKLNKVVNDKEVARILKNMETRAKGRGGSGGLAGITKAGHLRGARNPQIQTWIKYGKDQHKRLESSKSCDLNEVPISGAPKRPDCISTRGCMVYEFKPERSADSSSASGQVAEYAALLNDVIDEINENMEVAKEVAKNDKLVDALLDSPSCLRSGFDAQIISYKRCDGPKIECPSAD